jgi:xanthine dehydrogenase accessory factor
LARSGGRGALITVLAGGTPGTKLFVGADRATAGSLGSPIWRRQSSRSPRELMWSERSERRELGQVTLFVDVTFPAPRLIAFGAVDFAGALCRIARATGWRPYVVDPRERFAPARPLPRRRAGDRGTGRRGRSRSSAASTARRRSRCSHTTRSSMTSR